MKKQALMPRGEHAKLVAMMKEVMAAKGWSPRKWSMLATGKPDTVRHILDGRSISPRIDTLTSLGTAAGRSLVTGGPTESTFDEETFRPPAPPTGDRLTLIGYIGAGDKVYHFGIGESRVDVPAPPGVKRGIAAEVRGESMLPVYRNGDLVIGSEHADDIALLIGRDCFVQVADGPLYLKIIRRGSKGRFNLESYNDSAIISNQVVEWAAPVAWVKRA